MHLSIVILLRMPFSQGWFAGLLERCCSLGRGGSVSTNLVQLCNVLIRRTPVQCLHPMGYAWDGLRILKILEKQKRAKRTIINTNTPKTPNLKHHCVFINAQGTM